MTASAGPEQTDLEFDYSLLLGFRPSFLTQHPRNQVQERLRYELPIEFGRDVVLTGFTHSLTEYSIPR